MSFFGMLGNDLAIDLGTANVLISATGRGVIINEPCVVAVNAQSRRQVLAVGEEAKRMRWRTPEGIIAVRPMHEGVIADYDIAEIMLKHFIKKACRSFFSLVPPRICVAVPYGVTHVERRAVNEAVKGAGGREVFIIEEPMAAAIGAGLPINDPSGSMIVDIGGGTLQSAVISLGGIVTANCLRMGGNRFDEAIIEYLKKEHNLLIGERTAEDVKINIGSAMQLSPVQTMTVRGRDLVTGYPRLIEINSDEVLEAMKEPLLDIIGTIKSTLENTPPELAADIIQRGIVMCGGGSLLSGLDTLVSIETGVPVYLAEKTYECVSQGAAKVLENRELLDHLVSLAGEE